MSKKQFVGMTFVIFLSGAVFWWEIKDQSFSTIMNTITSINWFYLVVALLVMLLSFVTDSWTLYILEKNRTKKKPQAWAFFRVPALQALFNAITPFSSGGQPAQLLGLVQMGVEGGRATSILLMKFIIFQFVVLFSYLATIVLGFPVVSAQFSGLSFFILLGFVIHTISIIILLLIMFKYDWTKKIVHNFFNFLGRHMAPERVQEWRENSFEKIDNFYQEGIRLKTEKKKLIYSTLLTIVDRLSFYSIPYFILLAFGVQANYFEVLILNIMISMIISVVPLPGGSGGAEYSFKTLFATFLTGQSALVLSMFIWRFLTYFLGMILGLIALVIRPRKN